MAVHPPSHAKDAVPTPSGWRHPKTNELLKAQKMTDDQINEYLGVAEPVTLTESPTTETEFAEEHLEDMTKVELEELGREHGIELDRRKKKSTLVERVKNILP